MIRLFIFDMGGVLARNINILPEAASYLGLEEKALLRLIGDDLVPLMEGRLSTSDFWQKFTANSGISVKRELWGELFDPVYDQSTEELILQLKKASIPVVCGTNTLEEHYRIHEEKGDYRIFDRIYASHLMGIAKPDPRFFKYILDKEKRKPEETVFIDDFPENVESARSLGIHSFLFRDAATFAADFESADLIRQLPLSPFLKFPGVTPK